MYSSTKIVDIYRLGSSSNVKNSIVQGVKLALLRIQIAQENTLAAPWYAKNVRRVEMCAPAVNEAAKRLLDPTRFMQD